MYTVTIDNGGTITTINEDTVKTHPPVLRADESQRKLTPYRHLVLQSTPIIRGMICWRACILKSRYTTLKLKNMILRDVCLPYRTAWTQAVLSANL